MGGVRIVHQGGIRYLGHYAEAGQGFDMARTGKFVSQLVVIHVVFIVEFFDKVLTCTGQQGP